jgi:hypothetical protein
MAKRRGKLRRRGRRRGKLPVATSSAFISPAGITAVYTDGRIERFGEELVFADDLDAIVEEVLRRLPEGTGVRFGLSSLIHGGHGFSLRAQYILKCATYKDNRGISFEGPEPAEGVEEVLAIRESAATRRERPPVREIDLKSRAKIRDMDFYRRRRIMELYRGESP